MASEPDTQMSNCPYCGSQLLRTEFGVDHLLDDGHIKHGCPLHFKIHVAFGDWEIDGKNDERDEIIIAATNAALRAIDERRGAHVGK